MSIRISKNRVALSSIPLNLAAEVDVASATTTSIGAALSNNVRITGTTTITSLGTADAGITRTIRFAGILTLTYNDTSLILPGRVTIVTAANDTAEFLSLGSGNWICTQYTRVGWKGAVYADTASTTVNYTSGVVSSLVTVVDGVTYTKTFTGDPVTTITVTDGTTTWTKTITYTNGQVTAVGPWV